VDPEVKFEKAKRSYDFYGDGSVAVGAVFWTLSRQVKNNLFKKVSR
jgi:hypothetical protein